MLHRSAKKDGKDWLRSDFDVWGDSDGDSQQQATGRDIAAASSDHATDMRENEFHSPARITSDDVKNLGGPCKVILRCRQARTPWECVVRAIVGEPVHVDVVLARQVEL